MERKAREFVDSLPANGVRLIIGGYWGVMATVADRAAERGIPVLFMLPESPQVEPPASEYFIPVKTGLDYKGRSIVLVKSSDVLAVLGGESGTMIEVLLAYALGVPVVLLRKTGLSTDRLTACFGEHIDSRKTSRIVYVDDPRSLAVVSVKLAKRG
jgi:uncharacterized protein (TIGR00725 family)